MLPSLVNTWWPFYKCPIFSEQHQRHEGEPPLCRTEGHINTIWVTAYAGAICLAANICAAQDDQTAFPDAAQLTELLDVFDVPGLAMSTLADCTPQNVMTVGKADLSTGADVTRQTDYEAATLTKPVYAYLDMTLVQEGLIILDQPLATRFDYARIADKAAYAQLTPRMILTHRTGLSIWVDEGTDFHLRSANIPFTYVPGHQFTYSGEAFQLLQAYIEDQTGQTFQEIFEERLGHVMPHSTLQLPLPESVTPSRGYTSAHDPESGRDMVNLF